MIRFVNSAPLFFLLLPAFFVLHGFTEHYDFVPVSDALLLTLLYIASALSIGVVAWLFYRDYTKACLVSFGIMAYHFFFGSIQDGLRKHFPDTFIARYSFILPASFIIFLVIVIWLKKRKKNLFRLTYYLNILLLLIFTVDTGWLISKIITLKKTSSFNIATESFTKCDDCQKPDIFLVILDEYAGNTELKELFNFDNVSFENELGRRGFHIIQQSRSNYNYTPFSMASLLNMDYLDLNMETKGQGNIGYCYKTIKNSLALKFLTAQGYQFYNYSIFDFTGQPAQTNETFLPNRTKLVTSQTFLSRLVNDINFNIVTGKFIFNPMLKKFTYDDLHNNENILHLTSDIAARQTVSPKFVYAHLMMPHYPYYYDSKGNPLPLEKLVEGSQTNTNNYTQYLQYCNKKILKLVDNILKTSHDPPVIMLLGDHGFREFRKKIKEKYYFFNLNAVYLPDKNYRQFYDSMTNVNHFRVFFNTYFKQQLPLLKDSTIYLWN